MKGSSIYLIVLLAVLFLAACGKKKAKEDVGQLTYRELYDAMFEDFKNRVEWHEDDFNQEGKAFIEVSAGENCDLEHCGQKIVVKNTSADRTIRVIIKTSFSIPNALPYIANQFMMAPGDEIYLTCTRFCFGGKTYELAQEVVVAEYQNAR